MTWTNAFRSVLYSSSFLHEILMSALKGYWKLNDSAGNFPRIWLMEKTEKQLISSHINTLLLPNQKQPTLNNPC
jgi:hypothetical protein